MARIFISYSRVDRPIVTQLAAALNRVFPHDIWYDAEIRGGDLWWEDTIIPAIDACTIFIYIVSEKSVNSIYCRAELTEARRWNKYILPVLVRPTQIPEDLRHDLGRIQHIDMQSGINENTIVELIAGTQNLFLKPPPPVQPLWEPFTPCPSVDESQPLTPVRSRDSIESRPQNRFLEAAMPACTKIGTHTEVRVKISLPGSPGLRAELPDVLPSGDVIQKGDVRSSSFQMKFPIEKDSGGLLPGIVCVRVLSDAFTVRFPDRRSTRCSANDVEVSIQPNNDSRTLIFDLIPLPGTQHGLSRVRIEVYSDGQILAETSVSTHIVASLRDNPNCNFWWFSRLPTSQPSVLKPNLPSVNTSPTITISNPEDKVALKPRQTQTPPPSESHHTIRRRDYRILGGFLGGVLIFMFVFLALIPEQVRSDLLRTVGLLPPLPTVEIVFTPTDTPTDSPVLTSTDNATSTPTNTVTPTVPTPEPTLTETQTATSPPATDIPLEITPVSTNAVWTPRFQTFDGVEMALVPPGCFMMGSTTDASDEQPVHQQCFDQPFWIDRYEVTNEQFIRLNGTASREAKWAESSRPRENITWYEASAFCQSRQARLPNEAEWEYAAVGPESWIFPWGDSFAANNVIYEGNSNGQTAPVGSRPGGLSWVGAFDLSGNVWEWISSVYRPYPYDADEIRESPQSGEDRGVRGGAWSQDKPSSLRAANRFRADPSRPFLDIGFRCIRSG